MSQIWILRDARSATVLCINQCCFVDIIYQALLMTWIAFFRNGAHKCFCILEMGMSNVLRCNWEAYATVLLGYVSKKLGIPSAPIMYVSLLFSSVHRTYKRFICQFIRHLEWERSYLSISAVLCFLYFLYPEPLAGITITTSHINQKHCPLLRRRNIHNATLLQ